MSALVPRPGCSLAVCGTGLGPIVPLRWLVAVARRRCDDDPACGIRRRAMHAPREEERSQDACCARGTCWALAGCCSSQAGCRSRRARGTRRMRRLMAAWSGMLVVPALTQVFRRPAMAESAAQMADRSRWLHRCPYQPSSSRQLRRCRRWPDGASRCVAKPASRQARRQKPSLNTKTRCRSQHGAMPSFFCRVGLMRPS